MNDRPPGWTRVLGPLLAMYWLIMFAATHLPQSALPQTSLGDKTEHFIAYGLLGFSISIWLSLAKPRLRHPLIIALLIALIYGAVDELTQPIVNRYADLRDWLADAIGAALGIALASLVLFAWKRKSRLSATTDTAQP